MNSIEPRKIIKFGNSSFIISLPLSWIKENNLGKGDLVYLSRNSNNGITITPSNNNNGRKESNLKEITINVDGKEFSDIRREITSAYVRNNDLIILEGNSLQQYIKRIKNALNHKMGLELVSNTPQKIVARSVLVLTNTDLVNCIAQGDVVVQELFRLIKEALSGKRKLSNVYSEACEIDEDLNRIYFKVLKIVRKAQNDGRVLHDLNISNVELSNFHNLIFSLEYIGDELKGIARLISKPKNIKSDKIEQLIDVCGRVEINYMDAIKAFKEKDKSAAYKLTKRKISILRRCDNISKHQDEIIGKISERFKMIQLNIHNVLKIIIY